jgi:hypothetical protein
MPVTRDYGSRDYGSRDYCGRLSLGETACTPITALHPLITNDLQLFSPFHCHAACRYNLRPAMRAGEITVQPIGLAKVRHRRRPQPQHIVVHGANEAQKPRSTGSPSPPSKAVAEAPCLSRPPELGILRPLASTRGFGSFRYAQLRANRVFRARKPIAPQPTCQRTARAVLTIPQGPCR